MCQINHKIGKTKSVTGRGLFPLFEPENNHPVSIKPVQDHDFCVRHDRDMRRSRPIVPYDGALYVLVDDYIMYTCPECIHEIGTTYDGVVTKMFDHWDDGVIDEDVFQYVCEETEEGAEEIFG